MICDWFVNMLMDEEVFGIYCTVLGILDDIPQNEWFYGPKTYFLFKNVLSFKKSFFVSL